MSTTEATTATEKKTANGKASAALATAAKGETLPANVTAGNLNKAVAEVHALKGKGAGLIWELGVKVREIHDGQLWKARVGEDGTTAYKHWNAFCIAELGMTPTHAYSAMDVSKAFTRAHVEKWGISKLSLILKAPEEDQPRLLEESAKHGKRQLADKVTKLRKEKGKGKRDTGRKPMPDGKARAPKAGKDAIAVAALLDKNNTVLLWARPEKRGEEPTKRAKKLGDTPVGWFDLANGVRQFFAVGQTTAGELVLKINFKRVDEEG